jgi:hypothetical protein
MLSAMDRLAWFSVKQITESTYGEATTRLHTSWIGTQLKVWLRQGLTERENSGTPILWRLTDAGEAFRSNGGGQ